MTNPSIPNGTPSAIPSLDAKGVTTAGPWGPHGELGPLPPHLAAKAASIRAARDATIPSDLHFDPSTIPPIPALAYKTSGHLSSRQIGIVELCASDLAQAVAEGEYTAVEVTEAYIVAAALAHAGTNCLIWMDVDGARERAKELDEYRERTGGTVGPLHGVVLSVKAFVWIKGMSTGAAHFSSEGLFPEIDAKIVGILRAAGAIIICKTTQPQSIMHLETASHVYGVTTNSHNRLLTCGGSSGGEGALVGAHGSALGFTTDIGGSTRGPAAVNGLYGFKPTTRRVPRHGMHAVTSAALIRGTIGPIAHSAKDMDLFIGTVLAAQPWRSDDTLMNIPWRPVSDSGNGLGYEGWQGGSGKLRVGVMWDDGVVRPVKAIRRGLERMVQKLKDNGCEVVDVQPEGFEEGWKITKTLYYIDGGKILRDALGDEPMVPLTEFITKGVRVQTAEELTALIAARNRLITSWHTKFRSLNLDVLLTPAGPAPAQPVGTTRYWPYTSMWNLFDWPGGVVPTGLYVGEEDEGEEEAPRNEDEKHLYSTFDAKVAHGAPISLQLVAPRWEDERVVAAMRVFESMLPLK